MVKSDAGTELLTFVGKDESLSSAVVPEIFQSFSTRSYFISKKYFITCVGNAFPHTSEHAWLSEYSVKRR